MADFSINNTSQDYGYDNNTTNSHSDDPEFYSKVIYVVTCVITSIGLLLTTVAIYSLYTLVRKDHVVPIYVVNLLISDLIQLCCFIPLVTDSGSVMRLIILIIYISSLMVSVGFMVCIALARYLVIARPLWYRFRHTIKFCVVLCVVVWVLSPVSVLSLLELSVLQDVFIAPIIMGTFFLLPLPLLIFFLGGTIRALSASRVPSDEKRRIVGVLVLVLLIYTLLFLPAIILFMTEKDIHHLPLVANVFVKLSPLADLFLYVFMRKGTIDKFLASVCCCRMDSNDSSRMDSNDISSSTV
ncbi:ovarian cancer G-protein coupled receptor 1-like [Acanthopagrus latus]|uniref:ovarian cancer G-protein coupled receptor 1-like n=1 Tax=Acanthopagrus latus TaxID=8177 RepID=UPI00187BDBC7|nr:ovarian cancer G-protein coupled receptor 1-like [Acanthopagrus latus]